MSSLSYGDSGVVVNSDFNGETANQEAANELSDNNANGRADHNLVELDEDLDKKLAEELPSETQELEASADACDEASEDVNKSLTEKPETIREGINNQDSEGVSDTQVPSTPGNLSLVSKTDTSVSLAWTASEDNQGVIEYQIYNGEILAGTSFGPACTVTDLLPDTEYSFTVKAKDAAGNIFAVSNVMPVKTESTTLKKNEETTTEETGKTTTEETTDEEEATNEEATNEEATNEEAIEGDEAAVGSVSLTAVSEADTEVPTAPTDLKVTSISDTEIYLRSAIAKK